MHVSLPVGRYFYYPVCPSGSEVSIWIMLHLLLKSRVKLMDSIYLLFLSPLTTVHVIDSNYDIFSPYSNLPGELKLLRSKYIDFTF